MSGPVVMIVLVFTGILVMAGGTFEWGLFMENRRVRLVVDLFGRDGARAFYVAIGMTMIMAVMAMS